MISNDCHRGAINQTQNKANPLQSQTPNLTYPLDGPKYVQIPYKSWFLGGAECERVMGLHGYMHQSVRPLNQADFGDV